jgi:hypothetical protein
MHHFSDIFHNYFKIPVHLSAFIKDKLANMPLAYLKMRSDLLAWALLILAYQGMCQPVMAMSFSYEERCNTQLTPQCQKMVLAQGLINKESFAQLREFTKDLPAGTWIAFTSPGGNLINGMQMGSLIRERRFNTTISYTEHSPSDCLSACAYAFLGGTSRHLPANSRYGLHQFRGLETAISAEDTQKLSAILAKYVDAMGIDRRILDIAQLTSSDKVTVLTPTQIKQFRIDNLGQSPYPRWRLDSTPQGQLIALNSFATNLNGTSATIGLMRVKDSVLFILYYKTTQVGLMHAGTQLSIEIGEQSYPLTQLGTWEPKTDGTQGNFSIPATLLKALSNLPEDGSALLLAQNAVINSSSASANNNATIKGYFGVGGFKNTLQVLLNRN